MLMSCYECNQISRADDVKHRAKTARQRTDTVLLALNPDRKPAKHEPEEDKEDKLCYLQLRTVYAGHWAVKCMGCKCTLAALGRTHSKMPSILALMFLGF